MKEKILQGSPLVEGIGQGVAFFIPIQERKISEQAIELHEIDQEIARYRQALVCSQKDLHALKEQNASSEIETIIECHLHMLQDPLMTEHVESEIRQHRQSSETVFQSVIGSYKERFSRHSDPVFEQRLSDVVDVAHRVLHHLAPASCIQEFKEPVILFSFEFTPSQIASFNPAFVKGLVAKRGGPYSHATMIAKAKGIPYICGVDVCQENGTAVCIDGNRGVVIFNPKNLPEPSLPKMEIPNHVRIYRNIYYLEQMHQITAGVGLFRTETALFDDPDFLFSEEKQKAVYNALLQNSKGLPVTIRLFDFGGDKIPKGWENRGLESPFGPRGVRFLIQHDSILKTQLRSLHAVKRPNLRVLIPFVSTVEEIKVIKEQIDSSISLGAMIEIPSAALAIDAILEQVDFVSIGTNDLTQYTLAIDRTDSVCTQIHPSVTFLIQYVLTACQKQNKEAVICGYLASDRQAISALITLGASAFSSDLEI
ncbi:MAG: phosphoenolpyruvate-protein phosphotransferase [Chlamydiota bacterium]|jgi:phosphotransferase system enzyme I (PtsI)